MTTIYTTKRHAIDEMIRPALGEYAADYDLDAIAGELLEYVHTGNLEKDGFAERSGVDFWEIVARHEQDLTQWTTAEAAAHVRVTPASWRSYVARGYAPRPDGHLGVTPWWRPETITVWQGSRVGQGVGGGRPRHGQTAGRS